MRSLVIRIREGHGGTRNLSQSVSIEQDEDRRISGREQVIYKKKKDLHLKYVMKSGVSKNFENTGGKHQLGPRFALQ